MTSFSQLLAAVAVAGLVGGVGLDIAAPAAARGVGAAAGLSGAPDQPQSVPAASLFEKDRCQVAAGAGPPPVVALALNRW